MRTIRTLLHVLGLAVLMLTAFSDRAAAIQGITLPSSGGKLLIGKFFGATYAAFQASNGACTIWLLSPTGSMVTDLVVQGTNGDDRMEVFDVPGETSNLICGARATAVDRNGFTVTFNGRNGADHLKDADVMLGGGGEDFLATEGYSLAETGIAHLDGGTENDILASERNDGATLLGGEDDDNLCVFQGVEAELADGGDHHDLMFGRANTVRRINGTVHSWVECLNPE